MGNNRSSSSKGSLRPPIVRPYSMPPSITDSFRTSMHEDYVVLDENTMPRTEMATKGVAIEPSSRFLYLVDESTHSVRVMSPDFYQIFKFSGGKQHPMRYPWGVCIKHNRIFVTEHYSGGLSIFSLNGERIAKCSFSHTNNRKMNLGFTTGLTVDDAGNIYICDQSNHRILILSHDIEGYIEFARSTLQQPSDIKIRNDFLIILDTLQGMKKSKYADKWVLRIYSQKEELVRLIRLDTIKLASFFDITKNFNFVISDQSQIKLISYSGVELNTIGNGILDIDATYQPGIVVDRQTDELIALSSAEFMRVAFIKFPINDNMYF